MGAQVTCFKGIVLCKHVLNTEIPLNGVRILLVHHYVVSSSFLLRGQGGERLDDTCNRQNATILEEVATAARARIANWIDIDGTAQLRRQRENTDVVIQ